MNEVFANATANVNVDFSFAIRYCAYATYSCGKLNLKTQQQQPVSALRLPLIEMFL